MNGVGSISKHEIIWIFKQIKAVIEVIITKLEQCK